jgi:hypothetical protein
MSNDNSMTLTRRRFLTRGAMAASAVALPYYFRPLRWGVAEPLRPANAS